MTYSLDLLTRLKAKRDGASDYAIAKELGIATQTFTKVRSNKRQFSDEIGIKFAHALDLNPIEVVARLHIEKETSPLLTVLWHEILEETIAVERLVKEGVRVTDVA